MPTCSRCECRISIFSRRRKCSKCSRRICKECCAKDDKQPSSNPSRPAAAVRSHSLLSMSSSSSQSHAPLTRHSTMSQFCSAGCRDVKGVGGDEDSQRLSGVGDQGTEFSPRSPLESSPQPSPCEGKPQIDTSPNNGFHIGKISTFSPLNRTHGMNSKEQRIQRMVDAATAFLISIWLWTIWSAISVAVVNNSLYQSPTGLLALFILLGTLYHARLPRNTKLDES